MADDDGAAVVEFALLLPFLAILVFGTIDVARAFQLRNRLTNAAREGVQFAQFDPYAVGSVVSPNSCAGGRNIGARVVGEDPRMATLPGFAMTVSRIPGSGGTVTSYTGCGRPTTPAVTFNTVSNDRVRVEASSQFRVLTPLVSAVTGSVITVRGKAEGVVQG